MAEPTTWTLITLIQVFQDETNADTYQLKDTEIWPSLRRALDSGEGALVGLALEGEEIWGEEARNAHGSKDIQRALALFEVVDARGAGSARFAQALPVSHVYTLIHYMNC